MRKVSLYCWLFMLLPVISFAQIPKGRITYSVKPESGKTHELHVVNSDGTGDRVITTSLKRIWYSGITKGRTFYMEVDTGSSIASLVLVDNNGKRIKTLISHETFCVPRWKPDGSQITYEYYTSEGPDIRIINADGSNAHRVSSSGRHPYWSPDGKILFFTRSSEVFMLDLATHKETQLTNLTAEKILPKMPAVSPNGKLLAFEAHYYNPTGKDEAVIVTSTDATSSRKEIKGCQQPYWTNDNDYIVCACRNKATEPPRITLVNVKTGAKTVLSKSSGWCDFPAWVQ